jgi:hypothetical protein
MSSPRHKLPDARAERVRQTLRLKLLALVLALALTWYALNPAPGPVRRGVREGEEPDAERREGRSPAARGPAPPPSREEPEELEWPEYISLD